MRGAIKGLSRVIAFSAVGCELELVETDEMGAGEEAGSDPAAGLCVRPSARSFRRVKTSAFQAVKGPSTSTSQSTLRHSGLAPRAVSFASRSTPNLQKCS